MARLGVSAGAVGAVAVGVVAVAAVIIGGTIYASEAGKARMLQMVADLAERDGAASQVAYECLGGTSRVAVAFGQHRLDLSKAGGSSSQTSFKSGNDAATSYLADFGDQRAAKVALWKDAYAKDANETEFDGVRTRVLAHLAPYENDPQPLAPLIAAL